MSEAAILDDYGVITEPMTLRIERVLPGPIERVWSYLTESELRRQWLATGDMSGGQGSTFELTWRNDELSPGSVRPEGFPAEHSMESRILAFDPPRRLAISWMQGEVSFDLAPSGDKVILTVTHRRVSDAANLLRVSAGWHAHLDVLAARLTGSAAPSFWEHWGELKDEYAKRIG
jgi:uncharacterized protein YndB with AHSA1/START domain